MTEPDITVHEVAAKSAICLDLAPDADRQSAIVYEKDADRVMSPASLTKLLTAILAIRIAENLALPADFELEAVAEDDVEGSGRNIRVGDRITLGDGIANLLVPSSNVTANMIARCVGQMLSGAETDRNAAAADRFVAEMNMVARELGMVKSRFLNPHGLAARGQRSTARELSLLVKECLTHRLITDVWGYDSLAIDIRGPAPRRLVIQSALYSSTRRSVPDFALPGYLGGKTGSLWPSVFNLAAASSLENGGVRVSIIMGAPTVADRYFDYLRLSSRDTIPAETSPSGLHILERSGT